MRIATIGGGPGGLFAAALFKQADPSSEVVVFERNQADATFGFGVVFSDATLRGIDAVDPVLLRALETHGVHWDEIEVRIHGQRWRCGGNGMAAIARTTLLGLLHRHAVDAGVDLRFGRDVPDPAELAGYDLVIGADGANSITRRRHDEVMQPSVTVASAKFIWLATTKLFDGLTFIHERGPDGVFAVHGYPYGPEASTFIVETDEESWRRAGLDAFDVTQPPGPSDMASKAYLETLFADHLDGHQLLVNNSRWGNFRTIRCARWFDGNVVILGDAAHTAHFSVGSGTKMAMEDAAALATSVARHPGDLDSALGEFEAVRRPRVEKIQGSAGPSLSWWEHFGRYHDHFEAPQFAFHFFSRAIPRGKLTQRDPAFVGAVERWWAEHHGATPLQTPLEIGSHRLPGRIASVPVTADTGGSRTSSATVEFATDAMATRGRVGPAGQVHTVTVHGQPLPPFHRPGEVPSPGTEWGLWLDAPDSEAGLPAAVAALDAGLEHSPAVVAVAGGSYVTRVLLAEESRMVRKIPSLLVDDTLSADEAATLVLSGRTDLVGAAPGTAAAWAAGPEADAAGHQGGPA